MAQQESNGSTDNFGTFSRFSFDDGKGSSLITSIPSTIHISTPTRKKRTNIVTARTNILSKVRAYFTPSIPSANNKSTPARKKRTGIVIARTKTPLKARAFLRNMRSRSKHNVITTYDTLKKVVTIERRKTIKMLSTTEMRSHRGYVAEIDAEGIVKPSEIISSAPTRKKRTNIVTARTNILSKARAYLKKARWSGTQILDTADVRSHRGYAVEIDVERTEPTKLVTKSYGIAHQ